MDNWVLFIVFTFPGAVVELLYRRFFSHSRREIRQYEELAKTFTYSLIVFMINIFVLKNILQYKIYTIESITDNLNNIEFLGKYLLITIASICITAVVIRAFKEYVLIFLVNKFREYKKMPQESEYCTVWDEIFESDKNALSDCYVEIFKDGNLISKGVIKSYSPPQSGTKELLLDMTQAMEEYMENDKQLTEDEKIFGIIKQEYYDIDTGMIIKFYDSQKFLHHLRRSEEAEAIS